MGPAAINIQMVRENLALSIAFWAAAQRGVITSASVPAKTAFKSITNDFLEVDAPLELADNRELVRCVSNQIRSALCLLRHSDLPFPGNDLPRYPFAGRRTRISGAPVVVSTC